MWKFLGEGTNPQHSSGNAGSVTATPQGPPNLRKVWQALAQLIPVVQQNTWEEKEKMSTRD